MFRHVFSNMYRYIFRLTKRFIEHVQFRYTFSNVYRYIFRLIKRFVEHVPYALRKMFS